MRILTRKNSGMHTINDHCRALNPGEHSSPRNLEPAGLGRGSAKNRSSRSVSMRRERKRCSRTGNCLRREMRATWAAFSFFLTAQQQQTMYNRNPDNIPSVRFSCANTYVSGHRSTGADGEKRDKVFSSSMPHEYLLICTDRNRETAPGTLREEIL